MKLQKIFKVKKPIIGMVHFPPLLGYKDFPGLEVCLRKSLNDAKTLEKGGVNAIMFENNYDIPHKELVNAEIKTVIVYLIQEISKKINIPFGINVLWNDYKTALLIAKMTGASFIRVPVFVDSVKTDCGRIFANPKKVFAFRKEIKANDVALFTDIHVKHAKMLKNRNISLSAREAEKNGSDAIIITGKWTGDAPKMNDLEAVRNAVGKYFPILIGSGATKENVKDLLKFTDGIIIGTALKEGNVKSDEVNLKPWKEKISLKKTQEFVRKVQELS